MGIYDIDNLVRRVVKGENTPAGMGRMGGMGMRGQGVGMGTGTGLGVQAAATAEDVVRIIESVLDKIPAVQQASGQITLKLTNSSTPKTLAFRYR